jgi:hypothetical protein
MDLSKIDGLTEDQIAAIKAVHDDDVTGLKTKNTQLLDEAKHAKASSHEKDAAVEEARRAAADAAEQKLLAEGKYKEASELREKERAELVAEANANADKYKATLSEYHLSTAKNGVLHKVVEGMEEFALARLDKDVSLSYDDNGNAITVFKHGDKEFATAADFIDGVSDDAGWGRMLKGADSSGAGGKQSVNGGHLPSGNKTQSALEQRLKSKGLNA